MVKIVAGLVLALLLAAIRNTTGVLAAGIILLGHVGAAVWMLKAWGREKPSPPAPLPHGEGSQIASSTTPSSSISIGRRSWIVAGVSIEFLLLAILLNYAGSILKLPPEWMLMPLLAVLLLALLTPSAGVAGDVRELRRGAFAPAVLLIVPIVLLLTPTQLLTVREDDAVLRVMTYNIHQGIDNRGYVALEWMAQTIEAEDVDIVLLQEVTRSALVNGGIDSIEWLSRRLGMPYHFFAADRQFGNATLTRLPIVRADAGLLPRNDEALNRNYVRVVVQVGSETLTVINTHLDHMQRDNRMPQVERVIELWGGEARMVMGGDLNAQPDSDEINALIDEGMVSGQDATGNGALDTFIAFDPFLRLDWIFGSPDIRFTSSRVPTSIASDHLPVVVEIALPLGD